MSETTPTYSTPTVGGVEFEIADLVTLPAKEVKRLRRAAIDIVRVCDLALYGREDHTRPKRQR